MGITPRVRKTKIMRTTFAAALALATALCAHQAAHQAAHAADLDFGPLRGSQWGDPVVVWQGAYFAGFGGYTQTAVKADGVFKEPIAHHLRGTVLEAEMQVSDFLRPTVGDRRASVFGVAAGYNFQFGETVLGIEADFTRGRTRSVGSDQLGRRRTLSNENVGYADASGTFTLEVDNVSTLRARAGYTVGAFMPFVSGGVAIAEYKRRRTIDLVYGEETVAGPFRFQDVSPKSGWAVGVAGSAGVDVALTENVFVRGEWLYTFFPDMGGAEVSRNTLRAAAGVKF